MHSFILRYLTYWHPVSYVVVFLGMVLEGDVVLFTSFFLAREGYFGLDVILPITLGGVMVGDIGWYMLGERKIAILDRLVERLTKPFDAHILKKPFRAIFISKFTYGLHHPILIRAGALRFPFEKFIRTDFYASLLWILIVGGLGYISSAWFALGMRYLRYAEISLLLGLVIFLVLGRALAGWLEQLL